MSEQKQSGGEPVYHCAVVEGCLQACNGLGRAIEWDAHSGKGLRFVQLTTLTGSEFGDGRSFATLRSGEFVKRGIVMNFCPFCGANIADHMHAPTSDSAVPNETNP